MIDFQINIICKSNSILGHFNHCHLASKNVKINMHPHKVRSLIKLFLPRARVTRHDVKTIVVNLPRYWLERQRHSHKVTRTPLIWTTTTFHLNSWWPKAATAFKQTNKQSLYMCWCDCNVTWRHVTWRDVTWQCDVTTWHDVIWSKTTPQSLTSREDIHTHTN